MQRCRATRITGPVKICETWEEGEGGGARGAEKITNIVTGGKTFWVSFDTSTPHKLQSNQFSISFPGNGTSACRRFQNSDFNEIS